jgi:hypothetical protein
MLLAVMAGGKVVVELGVTLLVLLEFVVVVAAALAEMLVVYKLPVAVVVKAKLALNTPQRSAQLKP